jgi:hypothetical protein
MNDGQMIFLLGSVIGFLVGFMVGLMVNGKE